MKAVNVNEVLKQAVLDAIFAKPCWHGSDGSYYHSDDIREAINELPSVTPKAEWIPVSERLPECHEEVLVTSADEVGIAWYGRFGRWLSNDFDDKWLEEHPPIAWMPLPEPYKNNN